MKKPAKSQPGVRSAPHPLWMRLLTVFCVALLTLVSTVQVCHSHDEILQASLTASSSTSLGQSHNSAFPSTPKSDTGAAINCPLCVAMHSALPVTHSLTKVEMLRIAPPVPTVETVKLLFPWRFHLASRPPPTASLLA